MDVVCLGILVADAVSNPIDALPAAGQLKLMDRYLLSVGGCAANTAVSLRRLGRAVKVLGEVGNDLFGEFVLRDLERLGVETSSVVRSAAQQTSATLIVNVRGEDRRFIHCIGANADFTVGEVGAAALEDARVLYVGGYLAMPRIGPDDLAALFAQAKERGLMTVLDVVIAAGAQVSLAQVEKALPFTDAFLPNDDEARALTGRQDPAEQAEALARFNPSGTVVITLGSHGVLALQNGRMLRAENYKVDWIDQSGAGDAFAAGFIVGLLEAWPLEQTLRFASAVGASATRALGCTAGVFTHQETLAFIRENELVVREVARPAATGRGG
jgi:sugar/nucleoside kinase (ribokinase family)